MNRIFTRILVVVALVVTGLAGSPGVSHAAGCSGTLVRHSPVGSVPYGYVDIYYNSSTGNNCARTVATGSHWGVVKRMEVELYVTNESLGCHSKPAGCKARDFGAYRYYAGPVTVYGQGSCIYWHAKIYTVSIGGVDHCG